jgi:gliding motility-associated-like protein
MNTHLRRILLLLLAVTKSFSSYASHIFGGELLYSHLSGNTYKITLTLYADCGAPISIFNTLYTSSPLLLIYDNASPYDSFRLSPEVLGLEVSPVCTAQLMNTACNGGSLPGVRKFVYAYTVALPGPSSKWRFIFTGDMGASFTGRSNNISNINNWGGGSIMQLEATLNNTLSPNSSPLYSSVPTPYYCLGVESEYNQGAIDPDGDSLAFSMVPGIEASTGASVAYIPPYTATHPLSTEPGNFIFNPLNGQVSFNANIIQNALVVNQVSEYRGGVLIGTSRREMTFVITNNCGSDVPSVSVSNIHGGTLTGKNTINVCVGTPYLAFTLGLLNPAGDTAIFTVSSVPSSASLALANNNTPNPSGNFTWNTSTIPIGVYTFYLSVKNNHCPISFRQTVAYTINIVATPTVNAKALSPTQCVHQAYVQYNLANGYLPRKLTVKQGGQVIKTYTDNTGVVIDSLPAGDYIVEASCNTQCAVDTSFSITDSGTLPLSPVVRSLCIGDPQEQLFIPPAGNGASFIWYDGNHKVLPEAPTPVTAAPGSFLWYVVQQYKVCTSEKVTVQANVHALPVPEVVSRPAHICYGDSILLLASGGVSYTWSPEELLSKNRSGQLVVRMVSPVVLTVKATDINGCSDTASVTYENIEKCCGYVYPNAFTPNADGLNDGFRVIPQGNTMYYMLAVYNRWGERVFLTWDPQQYWNGEFNNVACPTGTYFYYFKSKCLTGPLEEHQGDVTLIR